MNSALITSAHLVAAFPAPPAALAAATSLEGVTDSRTQQTRTLCKTKLMRLALRAIILTMRLLTGLTESTTTCTKGQRPTCTKVQWNCDRGRTIFEV